jgi:hypothetical protein
MTVPPYFLLQTSDLKLRQVSRALMEAGPMPWRLRFVPATTTGGGAPPVPVRVHADSGGLPVYGIDVSLTALDALLEMMRTPEAVRYYWNHMPDGIKMGLLPWRGLMRAHGFITDNAPLDEEPIAVVDDGPPRKRAKKQPVLSPYDKRMVSVAKALHALICREHPQAAEFLAGRLTQLDCVFVACVGVCTCAHVTPGVQTFRLDTPVLVDEIKNTAVETFLERFIGDTRDATPNVVVAALGDLSPVGTYVAITTSGLSKSIGFPDGLKVSQYTQWPLSPDATTPVRLCASHFNVTGVRFFYKH